MSALSELEKMAIKYASEAIRLDKQGARGMAITMYRKAIDVLLKIVNLYPNYELNKVFIQRAMAYRNRIKALEEGASLADEEEVEEEKKLENLKPSESKAEETTIVAKPQKTAESLILEEKPTVKWDDIVGLEEAKKAIREAVVYPTQRPDLFPLGWPRGILLYGPPGCGKTLLAAAVANEINAYFYSIDAASIMSKWLGEAEKNVAKLFKSAREKARSGTPAIIFIDEVDSLLGMFASEVGGEVRVRNQFLAEMDGILSKDKHHFIYVMGATNKPWNLDWAFIRRFQKRIYVPLPNFEGRLAMFKLYTKNLRLASDVNLAELAASTEGFTGSDIRDICQAAQLRVVRELFESGKALEKGAQPREIYMEDFRQILKERKASVSPDVVKAYEAWNEKFGAL
ncbi:MAG: AAA family ATPase [Candidatus Methanomethylicota archaeon]|mgnify:FL=1|uniref:AAA family ATPase n=1 Tax=Thermoproteota archaeon TaxID=2056631 RepID=A0A497EPJ7_9CREN|nr:MAG: AAA family ATPase [Candidatus Verstraetearchaeota archaeon]